jgi:hypothetical protein
MTRRSGAGVKSEIAMSDCASIGSHKGRKTGFEVFESFQALVVEMQGRWMTDGGGRPHRRRGEDIRRWGLEVEEDGIEQ